MRYLLLSILLLAIPSASFAGEKSQADQAGAVALTFINSYVRATAKSGAISGFKWLEKNPMVTEHFKKSLAKLYADSLKKDPEVGYDADAVIGGQDCPESFTVKSCKVTGDQALVVLIGPREFPMKVNVALVKTADQWMVNASGDLVH
ncbi:MAG: hypothetical protein ACOYM3_32440 [Terrimicrobiaceae bacterium]